MFYGPRCKFEIVVPASMTASVQSAIAEQVRSGEKLEAMRAMREYQPELMQEKPLRTISPKLAVGVCDALMCSASWVIITVQSARL